MARAILHTTHGWKSLGCDLMGLAPCCAGAGDMARARTEIAVLDSFAPGFIASVFRGENPVFTRREDMDHLLEGLRLAGLQA